MLGEDLINLRILRHRGRYLCGQSRRLTSAQLPTFHTVNARFQGVGEFHLRDTQLPPECQDSGWGKGGGSNGNTSSFLDLNRFLKRFGKFLEDIYHFFPCFNCVTISNNALSSFELISNCSFFRNAGNQ